MGNLLPFKGFVYCGFTTLVDGDDFVKILKTGHRDIHNVVSWAYHDIHRRRLIEDALVYADLRAFGLGADADGAHASRALSAASK